MSSTLVRSATLAAAVAMIATSGAAAQASATRWTPFIGCWSAVPAADAGMLPQGSTPTTCVAPTSSPEAVQVLTVADGKLVATDTIDASGRDRALPSRDCTGAQRANFSADDRRVYLHTSMKCASLVSSTNAILAISPKGEWLDVRGVSAGGESNVRVARYHEVGVPPALPADVASALAGRMLGVQSSRVAAGAPIGSAAVIEASRATDSSVVEAWILERGQRFNLSARELIGLADAGVSGQVTDAMIAATYPNSFATTRAETRYADEDYSGRRIYATMDPYYDPYYRYGYYYGSPYGYGRYGYGYGPYYYPPVVIVGSGSGGSAGSVGAGNPQAVKGKGYTQNRPASTQDQGAQPRSSSGSTSAASGSSSSTSSQPAPAPSSGRTAKPRP